MPSGKRISPGVLRNYHYALLLIKEFENQSNQEIRIIFLYKTSAALVIHEKKYWDKFFDRFTRFLYSYKKFYDTYVSSNFKIIKSVFNYLSTDKALPVGNFHKSFRTPQVSIVPVVLVPEQLHFLMNDYAFRSSLPSRLSRSLDIFIFGCTVGLRIGDLMNLQKKHLNIRDGKGYISIYTQKTTCRVYIPIPDYCLNIIDRYKKYHTAYLLPRIQTFILNKHLKQIGALAGWDWPIQKIRSRQGKIVELKNEKGGTWKFYQHLSAHTMRRTAITTLLMMGVDEAVVRKISGHAAGSKEFNKYIALSEGYIDNQVQMAFDKLQENPSCYRQCKKGTTSGS